MECLGLGKKYKSIIHQEIAQKIRLIESIDKNKALETNKELEKYNYKYPLPKPYPLGDLEDHQ